MGHPLRIAFSHLCRETRIDLDITQAELGRVAGVSRAYIASIESGRANPTLGMATRIGEALGLDRQVVGRRPIVLDPPRQRSLVHDRCSVYVDRRLGSGGWITRREVEMVHGRTHGWIDLVAFHPTTGVMLVVEVKTSLDDIGQVERQIDWYERGADRIAARFGWKPSSQGTWLLVLASLESDLAILAARDILALAFPTRAVSMRAVAAGTAEPQATSYRGLALVDPSSRRRDWLIATRSDGRRSHLAYRDRADALSARAGGRVRLCVGQAHVGLDRA